MADETIPRGVVSVRIRSYLVRIFTDISTKFTKKDQQQDIHTNAPRQNVYYRHGTNKHKQMVSLHEPSRYAIVPNHIRDACMEYNGVTSARGVQQACLLFTVYDVYSLAYEGGRTRLMLALVI